MNRLLKLIVICIMIALILLIASIRVLKKRQKYIFVWFYFNVLISLYEIYIILVRNNIDSRYCETEFWDKENKRELFLEYWNEYSCKTDYRYFDKNNYVYILESLNVFFTILLGLTLYIKNLEKFQTQVLFLQFLNAVVYFGTLKGYRDGQKPFQDHIYRGISSLWLVIPVLLLINKQD